MSPNSETRRTIVIGAGISGLTAAYKLLKVNPALDLKILESSNRIGGVIQTTREDGFLLEHGPDCFLSKKTAAIELCKELGLEKELIGTLPQFRKSYILRGQRLIPVPEGFYLMAPSAIWPLLKSPLLSWAGKFRVASEMFVSKNKTLEDESLANFVRRRLGQEALTRIAQPMIAGIYTGDPERLSLAATMPQFLEMEREHGSLIRALRKKKRNSGEGQASGPRYSMFLSLKSGMQKLTDTLGEKLPQGSIRLNTRVKNIRFNAEKKRWIIDCEKESFEAEEIVLACAAAKAGKLLQDVDAGLAQNLSRFETASTATVNFVFRKEQLRKPFHGIGFVVPASEKRALLACSFSHQKFEERTPEGFAILRAFAGGALHPESYKLSDAELVQSLLNELRELFNIQGEPVKTLLSRYPDSMPQYNLGHQNLCEQIQARLQQFPGLHLAGNSYRGVGIPDCIESTKQL